MRDQRIKVLVDFLKNAPEGHVYPHEELQSMIEVHLDPAASYWTNRQSYMSTMQTVKRHLHIEHQIWVACRSGYGYYVSDTESKVDAVDSMLRRAARQVKKAEQVHSYTSMSKDVSVEHKERYDENNSYLSEVSDWSSTLLENIATKLSKD